MLGNILQNLPHHATFAMWDHLLDFLAHHPAHLAAWGNILIRLLLLIVMCVVLVLLLVKLERSLAAFAFQGHTALKKPLLAIIVNQAPIACIMESLPVLLAAADWFQQVQGQAIVPTALLEVTRQVLVFLSAPYAQQGPINNIPAPKPLAYSVVPVHFSLASE